MPVTPPTPSNFRRCLSAFAYTPLSPHKCPSHLLHLAKTCSSFKTSSCRFPPVDVTVPSHVVSIECCWSLRHNPTPCWAKINRNVCIFRIIYERQSFFTDFLSLGSQRKGRHEGRLVFNGPLVSVLFWPCLIPHAVIYTFSSRESVSNVLPLRRTRAWQNTWWERPASPVPESARRELKTEGASGIHMDT